MKLENWLKFIYDLPSTCDVKLRLEDLGKEDGVIKRRAIFESPYASPFEVDNLVYVDLFLPERERSSSFLLFVHGLGLTKRRKPLYLLFPQRLARAGIASAFLTLPYHLERTPEGKTSSKWFSDFNDVETAMFYHQAVLDIRASLLLLAEGRKPFLCGISLGAMISVIALAVEESLKGGFLILGGGNYERIIWRSLTRFMVNETGCSRAICHRVYKLFPAYLEEIQKKCSWRSVVPPKICFLFDPLTFAPFVEGKLIVMINAIFDMVIPRASALELWEALGRPEIHWLFSTHGSAIFWGRKIADLILRKLQEVG